MFKSWIAIFNKPGLLFLSHFYKSLYDIHGVLLILRRSQEFIWSVCYMCAQCFSREFLKLDCFLLASLDQNLCSLRYWTCPRTLKNTLLCYPSKELFISNRFVQNCRECCLDKCNPIIIHFQSIRTFLAILFKEFSE